MIQRKERVLLFEKFISEIFLFIFPIVFAIGTQHGKNEVIEIGKQ